MKAGAWAGLLFVATTFFGACGGTSGEGETEPPAGSSEQALSKPNGTNGDGDYCTSGVPCVSGEGDCDSDNHCTGAGVICVNDNGPKFGQIVGNDVCAPAHCANGVKDGPETGIDCGGPCGACLSTCTGTPGGSTFCGACLCGVGQGDCDQDADCVPGLVCGALQGPKFGMGAAVDACVEPHCLNGLADAGEEGIDCGGGCGACLETCNGTEGSSSFCVGCLCSAGKGDCDADSECALGLVCAGNYGPKFGFGATTDVCVVAHCYNDVQDSGESGIDCGGECGACYLECPGNPGEMIFAPPAHVLPVRVTATRNASVLLG